MIFLHQQERKNYYPEEQEEKNKKIKLMMENKLGYISMNVTARKETTTLQNKLSEINKEEIMII